MHDVQRSIRLGQPSVAGSQNQNETYRIGDLAREFDITLRTLRFYEDRGLIHPKRDGSTRLYSDYDRSRLSVILLAKKVGFSLVDIQEVLRRCRRKGTVGSCHFTGLGERAHQVPCRFLEWPQTLSAAVLHHQLEITATADAAHRWRYNDEQTGFLDFAERSIQPGGNLRA